MIVQLNFNFGVGDTEADAQGLPELNYFDRVPYAHQIRLSGPAWVAQWRLDLLRGGGGPADGSWLSLLQSQDARRSTITPSTFPPNIADWSWLADGFGVPLLSSDLDCTPLPPMVSWRLAIDAAAPVATRIAVTLYLVQHQGIKS